MRRKDREIADLEEMLAVLEGCDCCRIGLIDKNGYAYIVPLSFGYSHDEGKLTLYFHCAHDGKKLELMKKQGKASFEADCAHKIVGGSRACDYTSRYASVMGKGNIVFAETDVDKRLGLAKLMEHYDRAVAPEFSEKQLGAVTVFSLKVTEWTCKANR